VSARVIVEGNQIFLHDQFFIDPFNIFLATLTAFVGLTTALFSRPYMRIEIARRHIAKRRLRLYHSMYQMFLATMLIALTTNNLGLLWVAMEAATLVDGAARDASIKRARASRRAGNISSSAASASRRRCSARSSCTSRRRKSSARRASTRCCGRI
jgi:hydrogenase-4 component F